MFSLLKDAAKNVPGRRALVWGESFLPYASVLESSQRLTPGLRKLGINRGQTVALLLPNVPHFCIAYFGAHHGGCPVVPLDVRSTAEEVAYCLEDSRASALIAWDALLPQAREALKRTGNCAKLIVATADPSLERAWDGFTSLNALLHDLPPERLEADTRPDDTAVILYTSGTTGKPKGAELSHFNMFFNAVNAGTMLFPKMPGVCTVALAALPLFHSFGQTMVQNMAFVHEGTVVLMPRFEVTAGIRLMEQHRVTLFAGVPTMYFALLHEPEASKYDLSSLRYCLTGGAPMPPEVMRAFDSAFNVDIREGYGLSETSPVASFNMPDRPKKMGSIGRPIRGVDFKLVDEHDDEVTGSGEPGEICIRGQNVMKGYLNRPEATAEAMRGGWFHTGDIATRDEEGDYFIVDRKKDMILRGGVSIYPREVEDVLYAHPAVGEAAVVGMADERYGEEVRAFVVLKPGQVVTAIDLTAYCKERLASFKCPRTFEFRDSLPKGPTGKILKRDLRRAGR